MRASFPQWYDYVLSGRYEAHCEVVGVNYVSGYVNVDLDCAYITKPKMEIY